MRALQSGDREQGRWIDKRAADCEETAAGERTTLQDAMPNNFMTRFVEGRVFEWVMTCSMIMMALEILIWSGTLDQSAFRYVLEVADNLTIGITILLVGWSRVSALILNGQMIFGFRAGPFIRAIASVLSAFIWVQFVFALVQLSFEQAHPSPGIPFWFMVTVGELYVAYQTVKNA